MTKLRLLALLALGLLVAGTAHAAPNGPPYTLKANATVGDRESDSSLFDLDLTIATPDGKPLLHTGSIEKERYEESTLAAEKGAPLALRRTYQVASDQDIDHATGKSTTDTSLQGVTVTVRRVNDKVVVTAENGPLSQKNQDKLKDALDNMSREVYPDHPVSPGDTWTNPLPSFQKSVAGAESASCTGTFVDIEQAAGYQCARLHFVIVAIGKVPNTPATMKLEIAGDVLHAIAPQCALSVHLSGPMTIEGAGKIQGVDMVMKGSGTMSLAVTALKFAGVDVAS